MSKPSICLAMIVKNEGEIITRCIESALPWIDSFFIIDTGSDDDTPEVALDALGDLPGEIVLEDWVDFGYNRSSLVRQAGAQGADYLLLLDADMTVTGEEGALDVLGGDGYYILQDQHGFEWWMPYLVKASKPWKFVGRTHEFLACDEDHELSNLYGFNIQHYGDGGTHPEKTARDTAFLEEDIASDPNNVRSMFYLAQTYADAGEKDKASELYKKRIAAGGWEEEVYISKIRLAALTNDIAGYLGAYYYRPCRWEALYHAIKALNEAYAHKAAYLIMLDALNGLGHDDKLFIDKWIEEFGLMFEFGQSAWYSGNIPLAKGIFENLLDLESLPQHYRDITERNLTFCQ